VVRQAERAQQVGEVADANNQALALMRLHEEPFPPPERPIARVEDVARAEVVGRHEWEALTGVSILKRAERKAARERARLAADEEIAERLRQSEVECAAQQREIDAAWQRLVAGDPETVLGALEAAFEDNEFPAAALDATKDHVYLLVTLPPPDGLVPERTLGETATGNLTIKKRTKTERNSIYMMILISAMAATAKEAFAVSPSTQRTTVLGVQKDDDREEIAPLCLVELTSYDIANLDATQDLGRLFDSLEAVVNLRGQAKEAKPLSPDAAPGLSEVLHLVTVGLGYRLQGAPASRSPAPHGKQGSEPKTNRPRGGPMVTNVREVPIVGEDAFFVACEIERHAARTKAQTSTDDTVRFEETMVLTHVLQWQIDSLGELIEPLKAEASIERQSQARDWVLGWTAAAKPELQEWTDFQNAMVEHIGRDRAEQIAKELVEPRLQGLKDRAQAALAEHVEHLRAEVGIAATEPETKACPDCAEEVKAAARKCRFCGYRFGAEPEAA
jgi:hypothetical protein